MFIRGTRCGLTVTKMLGLGRVDVDARRSSMLILGISTMTFNEYICRNMSIGSDGGKQVSSSVAFV